MTEIPPIHRQVDLCGALLDQAITHSRGGDTAALVNSLRQTAQTGRPREQQARQNLLRLLEKSETLSPAQSLAAAKAFSIQLALTNACENAYRTSRLQDTLGHEAPPISGCLIYVLTAHPTEVRSAPSISIHRRITSVLTGWFSRGAEKPPLPDEKKELAALISLLWQSGMHKASAVTPAEEIDHIAGQFSDEILEEILRLRRRGADLRFRTWVGGDKDGHPGINAVTLHTSLRKTRRRFHRFFSRRLKVVKKDLKQLGEEISHSLSRVERALKDLRHVTVGDGMRVDTLRRTVLALREQVENKLGALPLHLEEMCGLLELFPGLVLPVELREESTVFLDLKKKKAVGVIGRMLRKARQIAEGGRMRDYVQGLIVSMSRTVEDIEAAVDTAERAVGKVDIPIIPLFERGGDLDEAPGTVERILSRGLPVLYKNPRQPKKLEIMLGYSDTSKRMGAFASRRRIALTMHQLTAVCRRHDIEPVFFHGAGGSVTRGGGSIVEQLASWPEEARQIVKLTVQGEMVERSMSTPQIFRRSVERLLSAARTLPPRLTAVKHPVLDELAARSAEAFETLVKERNFQHFMTRATPYPDLCVLHLGSRPSHRPGKDASAAGLGSLRAIPWVLCFTQGRLLVPSWYGIGTAFEELSRSPEKLTKIKEAFDTDLAFRGFIKLMGFSLAKGDRAVFSFFADTLTQEPALLAVKEQLLAEERRVAHMVRTLSGEESYLWFRPWLAESILLRGSIIHPLSALEVKALRERRRGVRDEANDELLRIAIAGTAIGMLTTG